MHPQSPPSLRIVYLGTPDIALPTLEALIASRHDVVGVVSQPDRRRGRGRKTSPSPVAAAALAAGLPLLRPERVADAEEEIRAWAPDLGVVVAYGQFIPKKIRELPTRGYLINAHASLLPDFRSAAPIARAILEGKSRTGVSVMRVDKEMDAGPVALVRTLEIAEQEDTASLTQRLAPLAADAIVAAVDQIAAGQIQWSPQDHSAATFAPKLERQDAILDWRQGSRTLWFRIRALAPKPGATTTLDGQPLRILSARPHALDALEEDSPAVPGRVRTGHSPALCVATGDGWLEVLRVQRAGGKPLDSAAFLRGHPIAEGSVLGATTEEG